MADEFRDIIRSTIERRLIAPDQDFWKALGNDQTVAEVAAGVTPTNFAYAPGDVRRYVAVADGTNNDAAAFVAAAAVSGSFPMLIPAVGDYLVNISGGIDLPDYATVVGIGRPLIKTTVNGQHLFSAASKQNITMSGFRCLGAGSSAAPSSSVGGFASTSTGLITLASCTDVRVEDIECADFYSGISALSCQRLWIIRNRVTAWLTYGVLASLCREFHIDQNTLIGCDQDGAVGAYGISATGDENGGTIQRACSINFNKISGIPSWDGIMTHDADGLTIVGNDIRDVRNGIDLGHAITSNFVRNILIANNYIESTDTNTWGSTGALHAGIFVTGADDSHQVDGVTISGNIVRDFFTTSGMVGSGNPSNIVVAYCNRANVTGNVVMGAGSVISNAGVFVVGKNDGIVVSGNTLQGTMSAGAVRLASVTSDAASITGNTIKQDTASDVAILVSDSTVNLNIGGNASNSTTPFSQSNSTITYVGPHLVGTYTGTLTGCTSSPTGTIEWSISEDQITLEIPQITATSNTTAATITGMPAALRPAGQQSCIGVCIDNNLGAISRIVVETDGTLTLNNVLGAFTNSGTKGIAACTITYRRS